MANERNSNRCCSCCCKQKNKVGPADNSDDIQVESNSFERINGWTCPWHPLQIMAWLFICIFATIHFGILVNYLPKEWQATGYIVSFCNFLTSTIVIKHQGLETYKLFLRSTDP